MHVLSCRIRDKVLIGDAVCIEVLEVAEDHVRISVHSPDQYPEYQEQVLYVSGLGRSEEDDDYLSIPMESDQHLIGA